MGIVKTSQSVKPSKILRPSFKIILAALALFLIVGSGAYYLGKSTNTLTNTSPIASAELQQTQSPGQVEETVSDKCNEQGEDYFSIRQAQQKDWCELNLPLKNSSVVGYTVIYPDDWKVRLAGAEGINLLFNERTGQELFIQTTTTDLALAQADKATYGFEMSGQQPLVSPQEIVMNKKIESIGDKQVLHLTTKHSGNFTQRYFVLHKYSDRSTLYMFKTSSDNEILLNDVKQMISSMRFEK